MPSSIATVTITAGNTPPMPTIDTPTSDFTWRVGDTISFSGSASRRARRPAACVGAQLAVRDHALPDRRHLSHPSRRDVRRCRERFVRRRRTTSIRRTCASRLTATDSGGLSQTDVRRRVSADQHVDARLRTRRGDARAREHHRRRPVHHDRDHRRHRSRSARPTRRSTGRPTCSRVGPTAARRPTTSSSPVTPR